MCLRLLTWFTSLLLLMPITLASAQSVGSILEDLGVVPVSDTTASATSADSVPADSASAGNNATEAGTLLEEWSITGGKIFWSLLILIVVALSLRFLTSLLERLAESRASWRMGVKKLIPLMRMSVFSVATYFIIADVLNPPEETMLAFGASAAVAIGIAAQDTLKNIIGGITVIIDRPFQVGDKIQVSSHYGEVQQIGLRAVRIVTPDDSVVSIPNSEISATSISNSNTGASDCQVVAEVYIPAWLDSEAVRAQAFEAAATSPYVYLRKPIAVIQKSEVHEGRSMVKVRIKAYVFDIRYEFAFMSDMTERFLHNIVQAGLVSRRDLDGALFVTEKS